MRRITLTTIILASLSLAACGDDDVPGGDADAGSGDASSPDATPPPTLADICNITDGAFLDLFNGFFGCFPEFELIVGSFPDNAELKLACEGFLQPFLDDGSIVLGDTDALAACRDYIDNIDCNTVNIDGANGCDGVVIGQLASGADCDSSDQCAGDAYCDKTGTGTCGVCADRKADNANCFDDDECVGRLCSGINGPTAGMCRAFGQVGDDCVNTDDCVGRLVCNMTTTKCQIQQNWAVDDTCASNDGGDCAFPFSDLYCDEGNTNLCATYLNVGDTCTNVGLCDFKNYESCDTGATDKCVAPTIRAIGESCEMFGGEKCASTLVCSDPFNGGVCVNPPDVGTGCTTKEDCGDFILECVGGQCQYGEYSGMCPAP